MSKTKIIVEVLAGDFSKGKYTVSTPQSRQAEWAALTLSSNTSKKPAEDFFGLLPFDASMEDVPDISFMDIVSVEVMDETYVNHRENGENLRLFAGGLALCFGCLGFFFVGGLTSAIPYAINGAIAGAIIGLLLRKQQKNVIFSANFKSGNKRMMAITDSETFVGIKAAIF